jgi:hypothetical protein
MKKYITPLCTLVLLSCDLLMESDENQTIVDSFKDLLKLP